MSCLRSTFWLTLGNSGSRARQTLASGKPFKTLLQDGRNECITPSSLGRPRTLMLKRAHPVSVPSDFSLLLGWRLPRTFLFVFDPSAKPMMKALLRVLSETTISDNNVSVLLRRPGRQVTFETLVDHFPTATGSPTSIIGIDRSPKGYSFQVTSPIGFTGHIASIGSQLRRARKSAKRGCLQTRFWPQEPESRHATKIRG